jgi:hypothetical protein
MYAPMSGATQLTRNGWRARRAERTRTLVRSSGTDSVGRAALASAAAGVMDLATSTPLQSVAFAMR